MEKTLKFKVGDKIRHLAGSTFLVLAVFPQKDCYELEVLSSRYNALHVGDKFISSRSIDENNTLITPLEELL